MSTVIYIVLGVLLFLTAVFFVGGYVGFCMALKRKPPEEDTRIMTDGVTKRSDVRRRNNAAFMAENPEDLALVNADGFTLRGYYLPPRDGCKRIVIAVHGYRCNGLDEFSHMMPFYHKELGYGYFLPDLRSHGRSEGKYIGFGSFDSRDILEWTDYFVKRYKGDAEIILHGISMGAATVMLCNESSPPEQVKLVIEDCGYTNALEIMTNTLKDTVKFNPPLLMRFAQIYMKLIAGYGFADADCIGNLGKAKRPMLFIHGTGDSFVPYKMGVRLYEACKAVDKECFWAENAIHAFSYYDKKDEYESSVKGFISKYLDSADEEKETIKTGKADT